MAYTEFQREQWRLKKIRDQAIADEQARNLFREPMSRLTFDTIAHHHGLDKALEMEAKFNLLNLFHVSDET